MSEAFSSIREGWGEFGVEETAQVMMVEGFLRALPLSRLFKAFLGWRGQISIRSLDLIKRWSVQHGSVHLVPAFGCTNVV